MIRICRTFAILLTAASAADAFAPPAISSSTRPPTALNHVETRWRIADQEQGIWETVCRDRSGAYAPCDAICGHDRRASWPSYAPPHGTPLATGAIGCPGGADWCYASSYDGAASIPGGADAKKQAAIVAGALAGLGSGVGGAADVARSVVSGLNGSSAPPALPTAPALPAAGSTGGGGGGASQPAWSPPSQRSGPPKTYAIGSWKK